MPHFYPLFASFFELQCLEPNRMNECMFFFYKFNVAIFFQHTAFHLYTYGLSIVFVVYLLWVFYKRRDETVDSKYEYNSSRRVLKAFDHAAKPINWFHKCGVLGRLSTHELLHQKCYFIFQSFLTSFGLPSWNI